MKYSIIIPCWNQENLVGKCLDSVLAQSVHDWEALCTDDGGPDHTGEVLDVYVKNHCVDVKTYDCVQNGETKRVVEGRVPSGGLIKVIHQKNAGMSGARSAAKALSTGEWIINLDGDDLLSPFALKVLDACIDACPDADMLRGGFKCFANGSTPDYGIDNQQLEIVDITGKIKAGVAANTFQAMVFHRRICGDIKLEGENWSEERLYTARCMARVNKAVITKTIIYCYRVHPGQFTTYETMSSDECKCYLDTTIKTLDLYLNSGRDVSPSLIRELILHWLEWQPRFILHQSKSFDKKEAWRYWFDSLSNIGKYPMSPWFRFTSTMCRMFKYVPVVFVLCYLPDWLKRKGLHR